MLRNRASGAWHASCVSINTDVAAAAAAFPLPPPPAPPPSAVVVAAVAAAATWSSLTKYSNASANTRPFGVRKAAAIHAPSCCWLLMLLAAAAETTSLVQTPCKNLKQSGPLTSK